MLWDAPWSESAACGCSDTRPPGSSVTWKSDPQAWSQSTVLSTPLQAPQGSADPLSCDSLTPCLSLRLFLTPVVLSGSTKLQAQAESCSNTQIQMAQPDFWEALFLLPLQICLPDTQPWTGAVAGPRSSRPWEMLPPLRPLSHLDVRLAFQSPLLLPSRALMADTLLLNDCPVILESLFEGRRYGTEQQEIGQSAFKFWLYRL
ncbi:Ryanodine Receptor 1 [Manis pentadactyla]|nr:Ryanodine Receptor 1 [Manis pentadactyla]